MSSSVLSLLVCCALGANPVDGNRLAYLDGHDIYYPHTKFPKLITPQWVGEEGVDAVVTLAIDDMRDTAKYEAYLRPILQRLKQIDGRAPVSIMTCNVKPDDPQLQTWLQEGVSLEVHTFDHPCPLLQGPFEKAKGTYDRCVDLMFSIPNNTPVAYRMPCCDSLNTVSPRFYKEIFNKTTPGGKFLQISSSVFQVYTADDPEIPRELLFDADGKERFRKYFPKGLKRGDQTHDRFLNYVENYPYPYVIDGMCWEFPCMTPSDWEANFLHQPNNPQTVADMKAALDITVLKQGVLNLVFHPHGWIQAEQINELIDHAITKHGKRVKFLTFKEALERLNKNLSTGARLTPEPRSSANIELVDLDGDGYLDVLEALGKRTDVRFWLPDQNIWQSHFLAEGVHRLLDTEFHVGLFSPKIITKDRLHLRPWSRREFLRDVDGDGITDRVNTVLDGADIVSFGGVENVSKRLPNPYPWREKPEDDNGQRLIDIDGDGCLDVVHSDKETYGVWLFESRETAWSIELMSGKRGEKPADQELPPIVRADGTDNGFFVRDRGLHWINEDTAHLPNLAVSWDFDKLLGDRLPAPKTPRAAVESMRVAPGYAVELMAAEPQVIDPVAMQWGPDGKLWVVEMADYPNGMDGRGDPGGRVRFLEDTDNDGQYDKSTLFLDKVPFPNGVHPWKNGVLISAAPDIFFAADTDGDGKADVREVLYTGFGEGNQQHRVNGFSWGLDGWLYVANGDSGGSIRSVKTGKTLNLSGRDLRIHPETGGMEAISGQTQFGRNRDDWGNWFGNNNSRPLFHYVLEDQVLRRNPHIVPPDPRRDVSVQPGNAPVFPASKTLTRFNDFHTANRFTSACSAIVDRGGLMGGGLIAEGLELRDRKDIKGKVGDQPNSSSVPQPLAMGHQPFFVSEPVHNLVHREVMRPDGVTFTSQRLPGEQASEFLASTDNWFRPTGLKIGPDGALWIADMYRLVIEHPQWIPQEWQEKLNVRAGDDRGRIWRVAPVGSKPQPAPRLDRMTDAQLIEALDSDNGWQRDMAQQLLIERRTNRVQHRLITLINESLRPAARLQALATLECLGELNAEILLKAITDPHPGVRRYAVRLGASPERLDVILDKLEFLRRETDPFVSMELAIGLGITNEARAGTVLTELIVAAQSDRYQLTAALGSVHRSNLGTVGPAALSAFREGKLSGAVLGDIFTIAVGEQEAATLASLSEALLAVPPTQAEAWQWASVERALAAGQRSGRPWEQWFAAATSTESPTVRRWNEWMDQLPEVLTAEVPPERRAAALRLLRWHPRLSQLPLERLQSALSPQQPPEVQRAAVELAGAWPAPEWGQQIVERWKTLAPALRVTAREHLLGKPVFAVALLDAIERETLVVSDIDPETEQFLRAHRDTAVRQRAEQVLQRPDTANRSELVARYLRTMPSEGNVENGRALFAKRCAQCHKLNELGHAVGPDLAALTDKSVAALVTAVLDPNKAVEAKFLQFNAATVNGQVTAGLLSAETATSVTLLAAEAKATTLLRSEIDELWAVNKSLMPEGLETELTPAALADLAGFIRSNVPLPARKTFPGNEPRTIVPQDSGVLVLTPATAEIYGPTIVLEAQHGNLGWWSSAEDRAIWTVDVPARGTYTVTLEWACDRAAAGHRLVIDGGLTPLVHPVTATAGWDDYQSRQIGTIELEAGPRRLTFRPVGRPLPALMDLRKAVLVPVASP